MVELGKELTFLTGKEKSFCKIEKFMSGAAKEGSILNALTLRRAEIALWHRKLRHCEQP
jgi:hypothetical protein